MQKYQFLLRWNGKFGHKANYGIILKALCELDQIDCLDEVCKLLHAQSKAGSPPSSALDRYSDQLKREYLAYELKAIVDWPPPPTETFIKLAMIREHDIRRGEVDPQFVGNMMQGKVENILKKKTEIRPDQIFDIEPASGKVILVEGAPGSGKTTLCWYVCRQWGKGELFQQFSHVLMVELRDEYTQSAKRLADMLPCCEGKEVLIADELKEKSGDNVLIILEGWDELPEKMRQKSIFKHLIEKKPRCLLQKAVVLISSRSSVTADLQSFVKMRVETLGFTPDQIESYVQASFESEPHRAEELLIKIRQNPKLQGNCYLPLMLMLIVHMYYCDKELPESFCSVIIQLALTCLYRYRRKTFSMGDEFYSFYELPENVQPQFLKLCKVAFEATMEEKYSFSNLETESLGLMQTIQSIAARGNRTTQYFLHSSLQELCAAVHVAMQPIEEQKRLVEMVFDNPKDFVLRFYSALTHWENQSICEVLVKHSKDLIGNTTKYKLVITKPEPLSQTLLRLMHSIPSNMISIFVNIANTILGNTPFDKDEMSSNVHNLRGGSRDTECVSKELAASIHNTVTKVSDGSINPNDCTELQKALWVNMMKTLDQASIGQEELGRSGMDVVKVMGEEFMEVGSTFMQNEVETLACDLDHAFGAEDMSMEDICTHTAQRLQQAIKNQGPIQDDPQVKMGIPVSPQKQLRHSFHSNMRDHWQEIAKDGKFPELIGTFMQQAFFGQQSDPFPHRGSKTFMQFVNRHTQNSTSFSQQVTATLIHEAGAHYLLMLIHCIYEAQNPILTQILGPELVLAGQLNASDMIAIQSILEKNADGVCACKLTTLCLISAIPPTEMHIVAKAIETTSTITTLVLDIGCFNEKLVRTVLSKPTIINFGHNWTIQDEMDRIHSCESFFSCLKDNKSLQVLNLSYAKIGNHGAEELAKVVNTTRLVEINLTRCGIEEEGIKALATALVSNVHLSILRLDDTNISPAALRCVSYSLRHNNSLKILGIVEDPVTTELTEENLVEFIVNLCYNSSVVCIVLNNIRLLAPSLQQAVAFVNCTRRVKQQPQLSIDDEYTQNYNPELYNDMGLRASDIRTQALKSIDVSIVTASDGSFLLKELPIQVWNQTLLSSLQFIEKPKAIRSMSMSHILQPNSQTIHINTLARTIKSPYSEVAVPRQAFTQQELWSQERHQTLSCTLQFIDKSKAIRNMSMRQILQPSSRVICIIHL